jgi:hypothetical protein
VERCCHIPSFFAFVALFPLFRSDSGLEGNVSGYTAATTSLCVLIFTTNTNPKMARGYCYFSSGFNLGVHLGFLIYTFSKIIDIPLENSFLSIVN